MPASFDFTLLFMMRLLKGLNMAIMELGSQFGAVAYDAIFPLFAPCFSEQKPES